MKMYSIIVREQKWVGKAGLSFLMTAAMVATFFLYDWFMGNAVPLITACLFFLPSAAIGIILTLDYQNRFLGLGTADCCYQTMFKKQTHFTLQQIARVETKGEFILLLDAYGEPLARIELNMENADQVIPYIQQQRQNADAGYGSEVRVVRQSSGRSAESDRQMKEAMQQLEDKWKSVEREWEKEPKFYQTPQWIDLLHFFARALSLFSFGAAGLVWFDQLSPRTGAVLCTLIPFLNWGFWLFFQRVVVWKKRKNLLIKDVSQYVSVPFWGPFYLMYAVAIYQIDGIVLVDGARMKTVIMCVFGMLALLQIWCTRTSRGWREIMEPLFFLVMICFAGLRCWPIVLQTGEVFHTPVPVTEVYEDETIRNSNYYLKVQVKGGNEWYMEVTPEVFEQVETGDTVEICLHKSLLEDYMDIHLEGAECEW